MKVYFYESIEQQTNYTSKLLKFLCKHYKIEIVENPDNSDCILVSVCDISEIGLLRRARAIFPEKIIISGGFISRFPILTVYSDFVCVGEAYNFLRKLANVKNVRDIEAFPEIATKQKLAIPDDFIDISLTPILQCSPRAYYYYTGKFCPMRCKYCLYGALYNRKSENKFDREILIEKALMKIPQSAKLFPMLGSYEITKLKPSLVKRLGILDIRISNFLKRAQWRLVGSKIRTGVEFFSEKHRQEWAKPISNEDIKLFFHICRLKKINTMVYFVIGLEEEEDIMNFIDVVIPYDRVCYPKILFGLTYIDFQPFTAWARGDVRCKKEIKRVKFMREVISKNRRIRVNQIRDISYSTWRTLMSRCQNIEEAEYIYKLRTIQKNELLIGLTEKKYPHLLGEQAICEKTK